VIYIHQPRFQGIIGVKLYGLITSRRINVHKFKRISRSFKGQDEGENESEGP
jgi:hypothetical protein